MPGAWIRSRAAVRTPFSAWFVATERLSTGVPVSSAGLMSGSAARSSAVAKRRSCEKSAVSLRNGRWTRSDVVATCSVDGDSEIVSCSAAGSREMAAKVVPMSVNSRALTPATGATIAAVRPSSRKKRPSWVSALDRLCATGCEVVEELRQLVDRHVEVLAAAGERVAEPDQVVLRGLPGLGVEELVEVVELDRHRRLRERDRVAVAERLLGLALRDLDVLQAERRARPDRGRRVDRHGRRSSCRA